MLATRITTFYTKVNGGYEYLRRERHTFDHTELPQDHWHTETMHVAWEWAELGPLTNEGGFYDVGNMSLDEIRYAGRE